MLGLDPRGALSVPASTGSRLRPGCKQARGRYTCFMSNHPLVSAPDLAPPALGHARASERFDADPTRVMRIPKTAAIQKQNLASQTSLPEGPGLEAPDYHSEQMREESEFCE